MINCVPTSVRIDEDVHKHLKLNFEIDSLSKWVNEKYRETYIREEFIKSKIEIMKIKINHLKDSLKQIKKNKVKNIIKEDAYEWLLLVGLERIKNVGIEGVLKYFNNVFGYEFKLDSFRKIIKGLKENEKNKN